MTKAAAPSPRTGTGNVQQPHRVVLAAWLTIAGIALYVVLDVIAQTLPPHYSPIRQAESDLAVGPYGWIMTVNFVNRGLFSAALFVALWHVLRPSLRTRLGFTLAGIWTIGAFLLAMFPTDISGSEHTLHGKLHLAIAFLAFISIPVAEWLLSRSLADDPQWAHLGDRATALAILPGGGFIILLIGARAPAIGGLTERIFLATVLLWMLAVAWALAHHREEPREPLFSAF